MLLALAFSAGAFRLAAPGALGPTPLLVALAIVATAWVMLEPADVDRDDTLPALAVGIDVRQKKALLLVASQLAAIGEDGDKAGGAGSPDREH